MNELEDMVCHNKTANDNISNLFWGKYKLESQNICGEECNIDALLNFDGIVPPIGLIGLQYIQTLKKPTLHYETDEIPIQDDLLKILLDMNNEHSGGEIFSNATKDYIDGGIDGGNVKTKKNTRRKHAKLQQRKTRRK
jgi:hypothetical protein